MANPTEHHLEHATHGHGHGHGHGVEDGLTRKVAMTIAIIAAVLAATTMLGHRTHTETLRLQGEAVGYFTEATNRWGEYQAVNIRDHAYQTAGELADALAPRTGGESQAKAAHERWAAQRAKYEKRLEETKAKAEELGKKSEAALAASHASHTKADRYDLGELFIEFAMVLCSVCVLTRQRMFWYIGVAAAGLGLVVVLSGLFGIMMGGGH